MFLEIEVISSVHNLDERLESGDVTMQPIIINLSLIERIISTEKELTKFWVNGVPYLLKEDGGKALLKAVRKL